MNILELFAGTASFSNEARKRGHKCFMIDNDSDLKPDWIKDVNQIIPHELRQRLSEAGIDNVDVIWASPPCEGFSIAAISRNWVQDWSGELLPKSEKAIQAIENVKMTFALIKELKPRYWFIENPRGALRKIKIMRFLDKKTLTYCQYGDKRMKPTDIWTNLKQWHPKPMCHNGMTCHEKAPRGSKTGTQGLKNALERGKIPPKLCQEIIKELEKVKQ